VTPRSPPRRSRGGRLARIIPVAILAGAIAVVLVLAFGQLGGATSSARTEREVVSAADGVVQSTVTGTGNLEPVTQDDVDFQTSGTLKAIDVKDNDYVHKGQQLATLDSATDALTLKAARATLAEARTTLTADEKTFATEDSSSDDTSATVRGSGAVVEDVDDALTARTATTTTTVTTVTAPTQTVTTTVTPTTRSAPTGATQTTTSAANPAVTITTPTDPAATITTPTDPAATTTTSTDPAATTRTGSSGSGSSDSSSSSSASSSTTTDVTAATIDSDKLAIVNDEATVQSDRTALRRTRLTAPVSGTIVSLQSIDAGDSVSSGSDSSASSDDSSDDSSSDSATASAGNSSATGSTAGSSSSSSSSSSTFVEIDSLRDLSMTVSFTEADISKLKVGQAATVSLDALSNVELAGKVTAVSSLGTTDDDVVSYDATVTLDQYDSQVKPGMSASADVIIKQGHGVTVPSAAVTGTGTLATVIEHVNGKDTTKKVIVGLRGTSEDLIVSGVKAGAELVETETLPSKGPSTDGTTTSGAGAPSALGGSSSSGGFGGRAAGGFGGGAAGGGGPP
jgi:multidrug efflux pump subunit AcrA (membrane-fusion protein)